ncbi:MAG: helix-turn-helix domain-containing protein [Treponema sp.]|nr:helix-turn-helix domain-containing protein [Treponema sp.]
MIAKLQNRLVAVREALGLSQREFCRGIYVSQSYYAQIEGETRPINDRIIALICSQYGVSKEFLTTGWGELFSDSLPDIQLNNLLEIYSELDPLFKSYVVKQIRELLELQNKNKEQGQSPA